MNVLYNSDLFTVVRIDWAAESQVAPSAADAEQGPEAEAPARGGYESVDKFARKGIFIEGDLAQHFQDGVQALTGGEQAPSAEALDEYLGRYSALAQQPVVMH